MADPLIFFAGGAHDGTVKRCSIPADGVIADWGLYSRLRHGSYRITGEHQETSQGRAAVAEFTGRATPH